MNGHSACLTHASNHFHPSDDTLEIITFTRLLVGKRNAGGLPDVTDEFFRGLLERIVRRQIIHHHGKGVMPVKTLTETQ